MVKKHSGLENFTSVGYTVSGNASVSERSNDRDCKSRAHWATQVRILPDAPKICRTCHQKKPVSGFYATYGYSRYECKQCENRKRNNWRTRRFHEFKEKAIKYLGGKCKICGYNKSPYALEFNHLKE